MRYGLLQAGTLLLGMGLCVNAAAGDYTRDSLMPLFKLQKNETLLNPHLSSSLNTDTDVTATSSLSQPEAVLRSYDAIFYYPLHRRGVSIDLGLNLRLQEELPLQTDQAQAYHRDWLNIDPSETRTMVHAAAVFDLPFKGFQAGLSGAYNTDPDRQEYDYRAKLSYQWKNGLGLEGGWQHQQKSFDQQNFNDKFDVQTLFLDMKYRF